MSLRLLYIGELVGKAGLFALKKTLPALRREYTPDAVIVNANGLTGGSGIGKLHALYLRKLSVDVVTTGAAAFFKKDILEVFPKSGWLLRPENYPPEVPGHGLRLLKLGDRRLAVLQLLGQSGFPRVHLANPFRLFDALWEELQAKADTVVVDFHANTTAEKAAFFHHVDGRAAAVIGSCGRTLTADARALPGGSLVITDAGRTGSLLSIGGMDVSTRLAEYLSGIPAWARDASDGLEVQGVLLDLPAKPGEGSIHTLRIACKEIFHG